MDGSEVFLFFLFLIVFVFPILLIVLAVNKPRESMMSTGGFMAVLAMPLLTPEQGSLTRDLFTILIGLYGIIMVIALVIFLFKGPKSTSFGEVQLDNIDKYGGRLNFEKGMIIDRIHWDLSLDSRKGLCANNVELNKNYKQGGICQLGSVNFDEITLDETAHYLPAIGYDEIVAGHCYLVKKSDGQNRVKIQITYHDEISKFIHLKWQRMGESSDSVLAIQNEH